jgi:hypothetical protein
VTTIRQTWTCQQAKASFASWNTSKEQPYKNWIAKYGHLKRGSKIKVPKEPPVPGPAPTVPSYCSSVLGAG